MSIAVKLAERVHASRYEELPPEAIHWAKMGLTDYVGVTLAGAREEATRICAHVLPPYEGASTLFGMARKACALDAALVNGTASHALDYDDCNNTFGGHPSVPVLPALIAMAEELGASGRELINAYVTAFEAECCIARGVHFHHYEKGWHPTATIGVFGAAAGAARIMRLSEEQTAIAIAIAASLASGIKSNFGTMVKPLHVGHASRNGLFAALLARDGFTAAPVHVFEHKQGFLDVFNGPGTYDVAKIVGRWAEPFDIVKPGIAIKQYPCCGSTHPAIDCMLELRAKHGITADQVTRIESWTHKRRLEHTNRPDPKSDLDAKFSVQYCLARALIHGRIAMEHFEGGAFRDPQVRALLPRIAAAIYTDAQFPPSNHFGAEVRVTLADGRVLSTKVDQPHGRTSDNPLSTQMLKTKFADCAGRALDAARVEQLYQSLQRIETLADVRAMTALAVPDAPAAARAATPAFA